MSKDCPGCNCENNFCPDLTEELRAALSGLLKASRERADDYELGDRGYYYWAGVAKSLLKKEPSDE